MVVSENGGTPKSSILIGISIINHPFWGTPIFGNTHIPGETMGNDPIRQAHEVLKPKFDRNEHLVSNKGISFVLHARLYLSLCYSMLIFSRV